MEIVKTKTIFSRRRSCGDFPKKKKKSAIRMSLKMMRGRVAYFCMNLYEDVFNHRGASTSEILV